MIGILICCTVMFLFLCSATVLAVRVTGSSGSQTFTTISGTTTTYNAFDAALDGTNHPIQIPGSTPNYSYWACVCLVCTVAPVTAINNIVVYSSGTNPMATGLGATVSTIAGTNGQTTTNYVQATGTPGVTGLVVNNTNYAGISAPVNFYSYTATIPLSLPGSFVTLSDTAAAAPTGRFAAWLVKQLTVASTTVFTGVTPSSTVTFSWDEF
jgi:hypothetical protein